MESARLPRRLVPQIRRTVQVTIDRSAICAEAQAGIAESASAESVGAPSANGQWGLCACRSQRPPFTETLPHPLPARQSLEEPCTKVGC